MTATASAPASAEETLFEKRMSVTRFFLGSDG
jgi:hypothetical protein